MGEVYRASDPPLDRDVALKVLPDEVAADPERVRRFEREARAVAALSHPHIRAIYDVANDRGVHFAVMEFLEGQTLRDQLERSRPDWRQALSIATAVADGLEAAHKKGIVHRDVKPANVFLTTDGGVKILDFGLAHLTPTSSTSAHTQLSSTDTSPGTRLRHRDIIETPRFGISGFRVASFIEMGRSTHDRQQVSRRETRGTGDCAIHVASLTRKWAVRGGRVPRSVAASGWSPAGDS